MFFDLLSVCSDFETFWKKCNTLYIFKTTLRNRFRHSKTEKVIWLYPILSAKGPSAVIPPFDLHSIVAFCSSSKWYISSVCRISFQLPFVSSFSRSISLSSFCSVGIYSDLIPPWLESLIVTFIFLKLWLVFSASLSTLIAFSLTKVHQSIWITSTHPQLNKYSGFCSKYPYFYYLVLTIIARM